MIKEASPEISSSPPSNEGHQFIDGPAGGGIEFHGGYDLEVPDGFTREPDVFTIDDFSVPEAQQGRGLGTELLRQAVERAKQSGYNLVRMETINPSVIRIVEKLIASDLIKSAIYVPSEITQKVQEIPTDKLLSTPIHLKAEDAIRFSEIVEAGKAAANAEGKDAPEFERSVMTLLKLN